MRHARQGFAALCLARGPFVAPMPSGGWAYFGGIGRHDNDRLHVRRVKIAIWAHSVAMKMAGLPATITSGLPREARDAFPAVTRMAAAALGLVIRIRSSTIGAKCNLLIALFRTMG